MASLTNIKIKKELTTKEKRIILITVLYNTVMEGEKRGKTNRRCVRTYSGMCEKGFSEASLRSIAAKADTTTGSIYSRYGGKEELFGEIVEPAAEYLIAMFTRTQENFHAMDVEEQPKKMEGTVQNAMHEMLDYIYENFETFELCILWNKISTFCRTSGRDRDKIYLSLYGRYAYGKADAECHYRRFCAYYDNSTL